jgi:hypothetical protein
MWHNGRPAAHLFTRETITNAPLPANELANDNTTFPETSGVQLAALQYPNLPSTLTFQSVDDFYRKFYFRPRKMFSLAGEMLRSPDVMKRRLREGVEFFRFLRTRKDGGQAAQSPTAASVIGH